MKSHTDLAVALNFLSKLSSNNNKLWFEAHRAEYEAARAAFEAVLTDLIAELSATDDLHGLKAKDCIARIYRDVRFSKDKTPYKTNFGALVAVGGWRSKAHGYYVGLEPNGRSIVAGGLYSPMPDQLEKFRRAIDSDAAPFKKIIRTKSFVQHFGAIEGERLKTAPKGYERDHTEIELLQHKQITAVHHYTDAEVCAPDFLARVVSDCRAIKPFVNYLDDLLR